MCNGNTPNSTNYKQNFTIMRKFVLFGLLAFIVLAFVGCADEVETKSKFKSQHGDSDLQMERINVFYNENTNPVPGEDYVVSFNEIASNDDWEIAIQFLSLYDQDEDETDLDFVDVAFRNRSAIDGQFQIKIYNEDETLLYDDVNWYKSAGVTHVKTIYPTDPDFSEWLTVYVYEYGNPDPILVGNVFCECYHM